MNPKKNQKFAKLDVKDYYSYGLPDIVVTKEGKVYSFNDFLPKDTEYPSLRPF
jgi:hypothetical protein